MGRFGTLLFGVLLGAILMFVTLKFHVVRANDGFHLVPKITADLGEAYVDIRTFGYEQWQQHPALAAALTHADKAHLLTDGTQTQVQSAVNGVLDVFNGQQ